MTTEQRPEETTAATPRQPPPRRWVTITALDAITPRVTRLLLSSEALAGFEEVDPGGHVKLILPPPGATRPAEPLSYEGRRPIFADGVTPPFLRTYTPLRFDRDRLELEIELLIHGDGAASNWLRRAQVGEEIVVAGPRGGWAVPQDGDHYLIAADETAIPAATQVLRALPAGAARTAVFEVVDDDERRSFPGIDGATIDWRFRGDDPRLAGQALDEAIRELPGPIGRSYAWVATEAGAMRRIRHHLLADRVLAPEQIVTRGYWKLDRTDHPDGDYGQEALA
ncbi:MAG: siderophore-interacting protein [Chloroflexi bacterium]|nr:siderophore-interacting protein [Chloroflexota bacterium]MDA1146078.1 siderophore-interacting protein [Chloroflexota bacterium]